ncbi:hypothetical protein F5884DRAFT_859599 [Xylogone sp. PMI_703]|nr:hypothetical protein F5884DRAFT_859599 [Xylogone sp. PMI_703]
MDDSESQMAQSGADQNDLSLHNIARDDSVGETAIGEGSKKAMKQSRKRTKTGCLTCRKRRIKCGEEKPTCQNCRKSKRECEGYHQRVIFKDPWSTYRGPQSRGVIPSEGRDAVSKAAEKPGSHWSQPQIPETLSNTTPNLRGPSASISADVHTQSIQPHLVGPSVIKEQGKSSSIQEPFFQYPPEASYRDRDAYKHSDYSNVLHGTQSSNDPNASWVLYPTSAPDVIHGPSIIPQPIDIGSIPDIQTRNTQLDDMDMQGMKTGLGSSVSIDLDEPVLEESDPYDVSDEEMHEEDIDIEAPEDDHLRDNDLGIVVALQAQQDTQDLAIRSYTSFIDRPNMLALYRPSARLSPLRDSMTARIFCHFINVTGPSISMFERHPANPSLIFQGRPVAKSQQHIWTYTLPTLALQDQALLHAMLALASLHIAKLQNGPVTSCLKHCAIAIRRIAKNVASPSRVSHPATLAATLLLGFYECWCGDHQKWCNHLLGARQLLKQVDYSGMTTYIKSQKVLRLQKLSSKLKDDSLRDSFFEEEEDLYREDDDVDENIVGLLMGKTIRYDEYGRIIDSGLTNDSVSKVFSKRELEIYETQRDLFWWYCRQDVYQSLLSGGHLFMEYDLWSHCSPRAAIGRLTATYGTWDHLILLLGRVADFASKDLKRKKEIMKSNGGQWRPPASMQRPGQQSGSSNPSNPPPSAPAQRPPFPGMFPPVAEARLPMGFAHSDDDLAKDPWKEEKSLSIQTREAEEEWSEILSAFGILQDHFGDDYQPLGPEFSMPIQSPFGTALQYRTYSISGIWMNYYMGLIALHRAHPTMPPAAMIAAGIAARQTAFFSNQIGRIVAGIAPDSSTAVHVNPGVGAALIESSLCLFLAGVQFQDAAQRAWVIDKFHSIARLTGWQSAVATADGCETYWTKAAELGRGPPYTKRRDPRESKKEILNPKRKLDRSAEPSQPKPKIKVDERIHYALGVLSIQEDLERLDLG